MSGMLDQTINSPWVIFESRQITAAPTSEFTLLFSVDVADADAHLVVDFFNLDNPVHPDGHLGWWRFSLEKVAGGLEGKISLRGNRIVFEMKGATCADRWINPEAVEFRRLAANAVLRSNTTNAIIFLDKVPVFRSRRDQETYRELVPRNWEHPRHAISWYIWPQQSTVRIVARDIYVYDAVGNFCLDVYRLCKQNSIPVAMYAENVDPVVNDVVRSVRFLQDEAASEDVLLYFFSTYDPSLTQLIQIPFNRKIAYFHGITKPELLQVFDLELSRVCAQGLKQVALLSAFDTLAANSAASADKLASETGREPREIRVIPPRLSGAVLLEKSGRKNRRRSVESGARLLYVGRIKSHKRIEDLLELFAAYLDLDSLAECWIVGGQPEPAYRNYLDWVVSQHLDQYRDRIRWFGTVADVELRRIYDEADAYISMSQDEGFCLPLFEAMSTGIPVFAYGLAAVQEVLGQTGTVFFDKDFKALAACIRSLLLRPDLRDRVIKSQRERAGYWIKFMDGRAVLDLLKQWNADEK